MNKNLKKTLYLTVLFFLLFLSGCSKKSKKNDESALDKAFPRKSKPGEKQMDLDKNGKMDLLATYDERGFLQSLKRDINENGIYEKIIFYRYDDQLQESRKYKEVYDDNEDGFQDGERIYNGEQVVAAWFDTDFNRKKDVITTTDRFERTITKIDSDGDGVTDEGGDYIALGNDKYSKNQYEEAYEEYRKALNYNSRSTMAYWGMAISLEAVHSYELAIKHFERYIMLGGGNKDNAQRKINYLQKKLAADFRK